MLNKTLYFRILAFILIITTPFLPVISNNLPPILGSYRFLWAPIWLLSALIFYPKIYLNKQFLYLISYGVIVILFLLNTLWSEIRDWDRSMVREEFYIFTVALSVIFYFRLSKDYIGLALLMKWTMLFILITAILSIFSSFIDPLYARKLTGNEFDQEQRDYFLRFGGGNYGFGVGIICLFPIMIYYYRNNKISIFKKSHIVIFGIICFLTLVRMQIFANVLIAFLSIVISLLGSKNSKKSLFLIGMFIFIFIFIPASFYSDILKSISDYFDPKSEMYYKLNDLSDFMISGSLDETGTGDRISRYPLLINAFLSDPFLGYYVTNHSIDIGLGGHLYWMNKLTIFGIIGFIPYIFIHYLFIKNSLKFFNKEYSFYYLVSVSSILVLGLMKNLVGREMWFTYFIILPGSYYLPILIQNQQNFKNLKTS